MSEQTKKCPKCSEDIQSDAKKCKHCNADLRNWFVKHKIITIILVLIVLGIIGSTMGETDTNKSSSKNNDSNPKQEVAVIEVTAVELSKAYDDNKVAADSIYDGKTLKVTGIIDDIGKDILDTPYVLLKGLETQLFGVQCMFPKKDESSLINLSKGKSITLIGNLSGELIGNVILRDCSIAN